MILALAFLLTVAIEWVVFAWYSKLGFARTGWFCLWLNGATWGAAMGVLMLWRVSVPLVEGVIAVTEAILIGWFWGWRPGRAFLAAVLMNLASWLLGLPVIEYLIRHS